MPAPRDRSFQQRVAAALDVALADPSPELVRAAERDPAAAHAELLARTLLSVPASTFFEEDVPEDLSLQPSVFAPSGRAPPPFAAARDPPPPSSARDPPPIDLSLQPSSSAPPGPAPPVARALAPPDPQTARDPPPRDLSLQPASLADPVPGPPAAELPDRSSRLARPLPPDLPPLPIEALGEAYAALAGRRIVRLDARAVGLRDPADRLTWLALPQLLALPDALRASHVRALGLSRELARRIAGTLQGVTDEAAALTVLARARGDPPPIRGPGDLVFQTSLDRRRAGAHYTPRHLADTVVRAALRPLLTALGPTPTAEQLLRLKICDPAMGSGAFLLAVVRRLADELVAAWSRAGPLPPDPVRRARRLVAATCVFGVDADPSAVVLARHSLQLLFGTGEPIPELDRALCHGDALLGLDLDRLRAFHWRPGPPLPRIAEAIDRAPGLARRLGDLVVGAFLSQGTGRSRELERRRRLAAVEAWLARGGPPPDDQRFPVVAPLAPPLHWPLEFSHRFDAFVGNPPFLGGGQVSGAFGDAYLAWLGALHPGAHGNADLCAHFLRRADTLLADSGTIGFIATNTVGQGDTRGTGLQHLLARGGHVLYEVTRDLRWPETAAVTVAIVHLARGAAAAASGPHLLHEPAPSTGTTATSIPALAATHRTRQVAAISSRLHPGAERPDPRPLVDNRRIAFAGSKIYGQGFLLTTAERADLLARDPRNADLIFPYLGGDDISGASGPRRFVINFGARGLAEAGAYPELLALVRARVKPERDRNPREQRRAHWWRFGEVAPGLYGALRGLERCVVNSQVGKHLLFDLAPTHYVYSHTAYVYATPAPSSLFAVLQSRVHEVWARRLASSMKTDLRYSIADCFNTFPFPPPGPRVEHPALAPLGERLLAARAAVLSDAPRSLTALYNALGDPRAGDPRLLALRAAHEDLDRAVLAVYEWHDLEPPAWTRPLDHGTFSAELFSRLLAANAARA